MNQNKNILQTNKSQDSENENILKRVSIYQIKTNHPMFFYY